jgi:hypothetical protein
VSGQPDKRFLIFVLVFGIVGTAAGVRWLSGGSITIREGATRVGVGGPPPRPVPQGDARVAGSIESDDLLYYPLCVTWIALGGSMVILSGLAFFLSKTLYFKLAAFSCLAFLLLGFGTLAAALWSGP